MTMLTPAKPDLAAFEQATRLEPAALVAELRDLLGVRLVAVIAGVTETRAVHEWAEGARSIRSEAEQRLRVAFQAARLIADVESPQVAQAWMQGLNPMLDDRSPAMVLRDSTTEDDRAQVIVAARQFAANG